MNKKYIEINDKTATLVSKLDSMMSQIEVKGESVFLLFNSRLIIKELIESAKEIEIKEEKEE